MADIVRRLPKWAELAPMVQLDRPVLRHRAHQVQQAATVADLRVLASRRVPRAVFDYTDGGAEGEVSLRRARAAYDDVEFHPRVLRGLGEIDTSTTLWGRRTTMPLALAPTGFTRMMHHEGERAVVRAAMAAGIPYTLSTMGTVSVEDIAREAPDADRWFQLYLWRDRVQSTELVQRAAAAGYRTLMLTADTPVAGRRLRDVRNGLTIPPALRLRTLADMSMHPHWWANLLSTDPLEFASLRETGGTVADLVDRMFDATITVDDLGWLREVWPGRIVVKGVLSPHDAREFVAAGADGVVVSNHGGRQLDRAVTPLVALPEIVQAVGSRAAVLIDGGVSDGADIVSAVAQGADAVLIGRAYLYGLMAGGEAGVSRVLQILAEGMARTMTLLGVSSVAQLTPDHAVSATRHRTPTPSSTA